MKRFWKLFCMACMAALLIACGGGGGGSSGSTDVPTDTTLAAPLGLSVEPGDTVNTVAWLAVPEATSYTLYWSETTPLDRSTAQKIPNAVSPYQHSGLINGKIIYYAVVAVNAAGESSLSSQIGATPGANLPGAPASLNAVPGNRTVTLTWSAVAAADAYNVYWSQSASPVPGGAGVTKITGIADTTYTHTGLVNDQTYYYVVTAVNENGESGLSKAAAARPTLAAPGVPSNVTATGGDKQVRLVWTAPSGATSFNVYWSQTSGVVPGGTNVTKVGGVAESSYLHGGLTNGTTYYYVVTAIGEGGESAPSAQVSAKALPPPPPAPQGLTAIAARDAASVTLQWYDVTGYPTPEAPIPLGYHIYRGNEPGLASYYKDSTRATKISGVTAPFVDESVVSGATYYYAVVAYVPEWPEVESAPSGEVSATVAQGGGDTTETYGSNLSFPVVFADGYGITGTKITGTWAGAGPFEAVPAFDYATGLRPLSTEVLAKFPNADATTAVSINSVTYYPQGTASTWQGEWRSNVDNAQMDVVVDWGDSLLSKTYTANSIVRIETVLKQDSTVGVTDTMTAYTMKLLSGSGTTELQGTDLTSYASNTRNVFAINARLKIEKISTDGTGDIVLFNKAVWESFGAVVEGGEGDAYAAEINQGGLIVYGYNLKINKITSLPTLTGQYRITFSLDPSATVGEESVPGHVKMVSKLDAGATLATDGKSTTVIITVN